MQIAIVNTRLWADSLGIIAGSLAEVLVRRWNELSGIGQQH
jgi:hypothetical protein